jgi:4-hydroxy-3-polyprenylbenzoate decarboxylase
MNNKLKIVVAITGASGSIYAKVLLDSLVKLKDQIEEVGIVMSNNAKDVWKYELNNELYNNYPFTFYEKNNFFAPFASGSSKFNVMIVCPCSMGTLARIAHGISDDLITRSADVMLKERRKLILVTRESPLNIIHINNMKTITEAGAVICPASPSFYSRPNDMEELAKTVTNRVIDLCGLTQDSFRWGESSSI